MRARHASSHANVIQHGRAGRCRQTALRDAMHRARDQILFCTLNTHKVDMTKLLGGQIGLDDFIFAHRKGRPKEVEITKTEDALGLTITDNGAGYAFIKRIKEGSVIDRIKHIEVGDHIEKIDGKSLVGHRHYEVAKMLKEIPRGTTFVMRLVEPLKAGFANIGPRSDPRSGSKKGYGSGKQTLRFKANGQAEVEDAPDDLSTYAVDKINSLLEGFMGINDNDLASQIWELGQQKQNTMEFAEAVDESDLEAFGFTDDFIFELWGAITDAKAGRLKK
ncbi:PDZ domain-containing protein GIPC1-like isoform X2 [Penaeus chinensis]|uniref:PDZ domain-containing protein GIPC1-like isoform X2 n=1 Tax=Penaeus chinensis TaxID=139456 RepID=UPI001FB67668|nr:PDZ domain-containing protein GIPC1-like isoform X2 [Penaeus chinensis]